MTEEDHPHYHKRREDQKFCPRCDEYKEFTEFYKSNVNSGGLSSWCKKCFSEHGRQKLLEENPEAKEHIYGRDEEYWKEYHRNYRQVNKDRIRIYNRNYYGTEEGNIKARNKNFRRKAAGIITKEEIQFLLVFQEGRCVRCNGVFSNEFKYSIDHILPLSKGGNSDLNNLQLLCISCNSSKKDRTVQYRKDIPPELLIQLKEVQNL